MSKNLGPSDSSIRHDFAGSRKVGEVGWMVKEDVVGRKSGWGKEQEHRREGDEKGRRKR